MTMELLECNSIEDFDVGVTLGTGSFGRVKFATHKSTRQHFAVKMLRKTEVIRFKQVDHILAEREILTAISKDNPHPFIVNLAATFQDEYCLYMIIEVIIGGEFFTHLRNAVKFNSDTAQFYASHIVLIFEHLHSKNVIYRDLKPEVRGPDFSFPCSSSPSHYSFYRIYC